MPASNPARGLGPGPRVLALAALAGVALAAGLGAAPFAGPKFDHSLCCPRGYNPLRHEEKELLGEGMPDLMPGMLRGADSAVKSDARRAPASLAPAGDPAKPPVPPLPAGPPLSALEGPLENVAGYAKVHFSQLAGFKYRPPPQPVAVGEEPPDAVSRSPRRSGGSTAARSSSPASCCRSSWRAGSRRSSSC